MRSGVCKPISRPRSLPPARTLLWAVLLLRAFSPALVWQNPAYAQEPEEASTAPAETAAPAEVTREVRRQFEMTGAPHLEIWHSEGNVQVQAWANSVVNIEATIASVATRDDLARHFAEETHVNVEQEGAHFEVVTQYPEIEDVGFRVDYSISVPVNSRIFVSNSFGDTFIEGIEGRVTVESSQGKVELRDLGGSVRMTGRGSFDLVAQGLRRGGSFTLQGMQAYFSDVSGTLNVSNFVGPVELRSLGRNIDATIIGENGPVWLYVPRRSAVDLDATAEGEGASIESDLDLDRGTLGSVRTARRVNVDATQRVAIDASFDSIHILEEETEPTAPALYSGDDAPLQADTKPLARTITPGGRIVVESSVGDIRVQGVAEDILTVSATRWVWAEPLAEARELLEQLEVAVALDSDGAVLVSSVPDPELASRLADVSYRVVVVLSVPLGSPLLIHAKDGQVSVDESGAPLTIEVERGIVRVERAQGVLDLTNRSGDIEVLESAGAAAISGAQGTVTLRGVAGDIEVSSRDGRTIIDSPGAGVTVHHERGDVRIIALDGIHGDMVVNVADGNVGMAVTDSADALFFAVAEGGTVEPAFRLNGSIEPGMESFQGRLNGASHLVRLQTTRGNIVFD